MLHELSRKLTGVRLQDDIIIREWLGKKAKEIGEAYDSNSIFNTADKILGISEQTLEEKFQLAVAECGKRHEPLSKILAKTAEEHFKK